MAYQIRMEQDYEIRTPNVTDRQLAQWMQDVHAGRMSASEFNSKRKVKGSKGDVLEQDDPKICELVGLGMASPYNETAKKYCESRGFLRNFDDRQYARKVTDAAQLTGTEQDATSAELDAAQTTKARRDLKRGQAADAATANPVFS